MEDKNIIVGLIDKIRKMTFSKEEVFYDIKSEEDIYRVFSTQEDFSIGTKINLLDETGLNDITEKELVFNLENKENNIIVKVEDNIVVDIKNKIEFMQLKLKSGETLLLEEGENATTVALITEDGNVPAPVGEHILEDNRVLIIEEEGVLVEIKEAANEEETEEVENEFSENETGSEEEEDTATTTATNEEVLEKLEDLIGRFSLLEEEMKSVKSENEELKSQVIEFSKETPESLITLNESLSSSRTRNWRAKNRK